MIACAVRPLSRTVGKNASVAELVDALIAPVPYCRLVQETTDDTNTIVDRVDGAAL
ncbi:hypothetical protein ACVWW6_009009 [Bradyrhizobium sp. USDA 3311]